jgi:hypothetical protein
LAKEAFVKLKARRILPLQLTNAFQELVKTWARLLQVALGRKSILDRNQEGLRRIGTATCPPHFR